MPTTYSAARPRQHYPESTVSVRIGKPGSAIVTIGGVVAAPVGFRATLVYDHRWSEASR
jgi:hypothetical protein